MSNLDLKRHAMAATSNTAKFLKQVAATAAAEQAKKDIILRRKNNALGTIVISSATAEAARLTMHVSCGAGGVVGWSVELGPHPRCVYRVQSVFQDWH